MGSTVDSFRWIAVALSMVLGLGITRLLASFVAVFRSRKQSTLDWIPLAWAFCIFIFQLQFWWAIIELPSLVQIWTLASFLSLIGLTLLLFIAAALILPPDELQEQETLLAEFQADGRWALIALSTYFLLALFVDWLLWDMTPGTHGTSTLLPLIVLPLIFLLCRSRRAQVVVTIAYLVLGLWSSWAMSPAYYT